MESFLRVDARTNLPGSPTNSFLADEVASICPLITPSPPTNDLINPLPEPTEPNFAIGEQLATKLQHVQDDDKGAGDSASSSSSAIAEPACTQLLNHRNVYHHINKTEETELQETNGKTQPLQLTFRNPPDNYFFMSWNWPIIRKVSLWVFLSGLVAMLGLVLAMISSLPRTCNPVTEWYQGNLFYEIFPSSFYSKHEMEGNFKGISMKTDYIMSLGVRSVRLNSIFYTPHYPHDFENVTTLTRIAPSLGNLTDFKILGKHLHSRNISLVLDLPLYPFLKQLPKKTVYNQLNESAILNELKGNAEHDPVEEALSFWIQNNVDGFYLKGLEYFVNDPNFPQFLRSWKKIIGFNRPFIVNETVLKVAPPNILNTILNNVDLIDVKLNIENGMQAIKKQISTLQNSTLFTKAGMPWILWSLGNVNSPRLANILPNNNATLGATLLQMMLPGTPSIFYGDEIGLKQIADPDPSEPSPERDDIKTLPQLGMMPWPLKGTGTKVLPWNYGEKSSTSYEQVDVISKMSSIRSESPSIYMNNVYKRDGEVRSNAEIKYSQKDFLVMQRWYPRRKSYVVASNLGDNKISADLSTLLYSGEILVGPRADSRPGTVSFKDISLWPGESVVIILD